jgi:hypothetical protein
MNIEMASLGRQVDIKEGGSLITINVFAIRAIRNTDNVFARATNSNRKSKEKTQLHVFVTL